MKKLLSILGSMSLMSFSLPINNQQNNVVDVSNNIKKASLATKAVQNYNPVFPNRTIGINKNDSVNDTSKTVTYNILTITDYAVDQDEFLKNYNKFTFNNSSFDLQIGNTGSWSSSKYGCNQLIFSNVKGSNQGDVKSDGYWTNLKFGAWQKWGSWYSTKWDDSGWCIRVKLYIESGILKLGIACNHTADDTHTDHAKWSIGSVTISSDFDLNGLKSKVVSALSQSFSLQSSTSNLISSTDTYSINGTVKSNHDVIVDEINRRLQNSFGTDYNAWFTTANSSGKVILKTDLKFDDSNNQVLITLKDEGSGIIDRQQFVISNIVMPVTLNLTDDYWQKALQERLKITPGKIVNPVDSKNSLMTDNPEYHPQDNQTYIYHNSVDLSFTAKNNSNEVLYVNGVAVPVYNNKYLIRLSDPRLNKNSNGNATYEVQIKDDSGVKMTINIMINSVSTGLDFKWLGWNPVNDPSQDVYYNQYLLITPSVNGETNPKYDPTINPDTGTRTEQVGINYNFADAFAFDPLNKYGNLIESNNEYEPYYLASASVVNSGVTTTIENPENIDHIERVKIDPVTLQEIGTRSTVDVAHEAQYSIPGLWHYIIYLKNYVAQTVDPKKPGPTEINASAGTTLHQFLYINNAVDAYASFLNQKDIIANNMISELWSSIHANHLKFYLANDIDMSSSDIADLTYGQIVSYWNQYVSDAIAQIVDINPDPVNYKDLAQLQITALKMNETTEEEVKVKIKAYVAKAMLRFSKAAILDVDYNIKINSVNLEAADLSNFVLPTESTEKEIRKELNVTIAATPTSTLLENQKTFKIINDSKYDESLVLDLSTIPFENFNYNFALWTSEEKANFIQNYIFSNVEKYIRMYKPKKYTGDYAYGTDYLISLNGVYGVDLKTLNYEMVQGVLDAFFNASEAYSLTITIYATDDSLLMTRYGQYTITNDPANPNPAPPAPPDPKPHPNNDTNRNRKKRKWWIALIVLCPLMIAGLIIWIVYVRKKSKRLNDAKWKNKKTRKG